MREIFLSACLGLAPFTAKQIKKMLPPYVGHMVRAGDGIYISSGTHRGAWSKVFDCKKQDYDNLTGPTSTATVWK